MAYRTEYPEAYAEGIVNKSISLSKAAYDLLQQMDNHSAFINDLIIDALQERDFFKKRLIRQMNAIQKELVEKYGVQLDLEAKEVSK